MIILGSLVFISIVFALVVAIRRQKVKVLSGRQLTCILAPLAIGIVAPSIVLFIVQITVGHMSPISSIADIIAGQFAEGRNLFLIALLSLIPFVLLTLILLRGVLSHPLRKCYSLGIGGMVGILSIMIPAHVSVWYGLYGGHPSSTAVIGFLFFPFYSIGAMALGLMVGWLVSLLPWFRAGTPGPER